MLNYVPDDLADFDTAACDPTWTIVWEGEGLPDGSALMSVINASRQSARQATGRLMRGAFQPELLSGFCAAG